MGKWHSPEEKLKIIQAIQTSSKSIKEACRETRISRVSYYSWVKRAANLELEELANKSRSPQKLQFTAGKIEPAIVGKMTLTPFTVIENLRLPLLLEGCHGRFLILRIESTCGVYLQCTRNTSWGQIFSKDLNEK